MNNISIKINNLEKSFGQTKALKGLSFDIPKNEIFGLIGPDGAGKTTLLRILTTLLLPDAGTVSVENMDVVKDYKQLRNILGYMPGKFSLYQDLSVEENLKFFATIFGTTLNENYDLIKDIYIQIEPFKKRPAGKLSGGMKQKLALCCALIHKPVVLILDEPTTGVDAVSRKEFWEMLIRLKEKGITIIVSTPYMDEASLCDKVALMQGGTIMSIDTPLAITQKFERDLLSVKSDNMYNLLHDLRSFDKTHSAFLFGQNVHVTSLEKPINENEIINYLELKNHKNIHTKIINPNIEDCFMELMVSSGDGKQ